MQTFAMPLLYSYYIDFILPSHIGKPGELDVSGGAQKNKARG